MTELYLPIPVYPKYEVSNLGNVRRTDKDKILKPINHANGYKLVHLSNEYRRRVCLIHRLVLGTFTCPLSQYDVNHIDGNKENNTLSNLEWVTKSENTRHAHITGLFSSRNKLTMEDVKIIKASQDQLTARILADRYNVQTSIIYKIWSGALYGYV